MAKGTKQTKKYQVVIGPFKTKKEAIKAYKEVQQIIVDISITVEGQKYIIDAGIFDNKEPAKIIKNMLKGSNAKIITKQIESTL